MTARIAELGFVPVPAPREGSTITEPEPVPLSRLARRVRVSSRLRVTALAAASLLAPALARAQPGPADPDEPTPAPVSSAPAVPARSGAPPVEHAPSPAPTARPASPVDAPVEHAPSPAPTTRPASPVDALAPGPFSRIPYHRLALELELITDAEWIRRDGPDLTELRLERGEAGATIALGPRAGAELRLESLRSAGEGGALGIDGDSIVVRIKRAQVFGELDAGELHLEGAAGVTADPWIAALEDGYTLRPLSATASERLLDWPVSDLAAVARAAYGPVRVAASFGNGEGLRYPERNDGKTTTAVLEIVPLASATARVRLAAMARDGSLGPARVRDRRAGGAATVWTPLASAGVELVRAWGIGDRGDLVATVLGAWTEARPVAGLVVAARAATIGYDAGGRYSTLGGAIAIEPWQDAHDVALEPQHRDRARLRLWLAIDRTTASGAAMPLPGADAGDATTLLVIASTTAPFTLD